MVSDGNNTRNMSLNNGEKAILVVNNLFELCSNVCGR